MATLYGVSRHSIDSVTATLRAHSAVHQVGLSVSEISRELGGLSRPTIYKVLGHIGAVRDDSFYPSTYTLPAQSESQRETTIKVAIHLLATGESDERETTDRILSVL